MRYAIAAVLVLAGCDMRGIHLPNPAARYQVVPNHYEGGGAWIVDTVNGEAVYCLSHMPLISGPACRVVPVFPVNWDPFKK